jgi:hypothetical protein
MLLTLLVWRDLKSPKLTSYLYHKEMGEIMIEITVEDHDKCEVCHDIVLPTAKWSPIHLSCTQWLTNVPRSELLPQRDLVSSSFLQATFASCIKRINTKIQAMLFHRVERNHDASRSCTMLSYNVDPCFFVFLA